MIDVSVLLTGIEMFKKVIDKYGRRSVEIINTESHSVDILNGIFYNINSRKLYFSPNFEGYRLHEIYVGDVIKYHRCMKVLDRYSLE